MSRHVVFGTGQIGRLVAERLVSLGADVTKAATRAAMTDDLLAAHRAGRVEIAIGRASDFFGPGITRSALAGTVFGAAVNGRIAQVMGHPDLEHSYSYAPDVAAALVTLGTAAGATGRVSHLPVAEACTTRDIVHRVYGLAAVGPGSSPPAVPRCGSSASSTRPCASTCIPSTSSASAGSSTTPHSVLRSAPSRRRSATR